MEIVQKQNAYFISKSIRMADEIQLIHNYLYTNVKIEIEINLNF